MDEPFDLMILPKNLQDSPVALYMAILGICPQDWLPEQVSELYESIMAEYEEATVSPLTVVPNNKEEH